MPEIHLPTYSCWMIYEFPEHVLTREVNSELVMLDMESEQYFTLDEVAFAIVRSLRVTGDPQATADQLLAEYDIDRSTLDRDISALIENLEARGLLLRSKP